MKKTYLILLIIPFLAISACGSNKPKQQATFHIKVPVETKDDVFGCYEKINFSAEVSKKMNAIEPWPAKFQWFCFDDDGTMYNLNQSDHTEYTEDVLWEAFKKIPKDIAYTIPRKGIIVTVQKSAKQRILWGASKVKGILFRVGNQNIPNGTLIMSLYSPKVKKHIYHRFLKRVAEY